MGLGCVGALIELISVAELRFASHPKRRWEPPCGRMRTYDMPATVANVQIFGLKNSSATRAAERFFKERRIPIHYVDLKQKPMSPGEIGRFVKKFGMPALLDKEGKAYTEAGLQHMIISEAGWLVKIENHPQLLKLPLVRRGNHVAIGHDEPTWKAMLA